MDAWRCQIAFIINESKMNFIGIVQNTEANMFLHYRGNKSLFYRDAENPITFN